MRALITSGAAAEVALQLREKSGASGVFVPLEYDLTPGGIDSVENQEDIFVLPVRSSPNEAYSSLWVAVKVNSGTASVDVFLEIERD